MKLWTFLTTDIRELNLKRAEEFTKAGTDTAKVVLDLAKTVKEQGNKVELSTLQNYVGQFSSLLDVLNGHLNPVGADAINPGYCLPAAQSPHARDKWVAPGIRDKFASAILPINRN